MGGGGGAENSEGRTPRVCVSVAAVDGSGLHLLSPFLPRVFIWVRTWELRTGSMRPWKALPSTHFPGRLGTQTRVDPTPETSLAVLPLRSSSPHLRGLAAAVLPQAGPAVQSESRVAGRRARRELATPRRLQVAQPGETLCLGGALARG